MIFPHSFRGMYALGVLAIVAVVGLTGCSAASRDTAPATTEVSGGVLAPGDTVRGETELQIEEPSEFVNGIGLLARARKNTLYLTIRNERPEALLVHPKNFGVIADGRLHKVEAGKVDIHNFQPIRLMTGMTCVRIVRFAELGDLVGQRLVYNNPAIGQPFYVDIKAYEPAP